MIDPTFFGEPASAPVGAPLTTGMSDVVLVIGGGIAGIQAALHLAVGGRRVVLVERGATLGGCLAAARSQESANANPDAEGQGPALEELRRQANIEILTLAEVTDLQGEPGRFLATIKQRARFVTDQCIRCGECRRVCPVVVPNEYLAGLAYRKAIYWPMRDSVPNTYVVDLNVCLNDPPNYLPCQRCVSVCESKAINFDVPVEQTFTREVRSVIVATGYDLVDPLALPEYGYGTHPDVMTALELEHILSPTGPAGGFVERPSNEETPQRVLFILGIGSRKRFGMLHSSGFSWNYTARHVAQLVAQDITDISVLYQDQRAYSKSFFDFWNQTVGDTARLIRGHLEKVTAAEDGSLAARYECYDPERILTENYDMIVLVPEVLPAKGLPELAATLGIELAEDGFVRLEETIGSLVGTTRAGVYAAGCASGPKDIPDTLAEGRAAAISVLDKASRRRTSPMKPFAEAFKPPVRPGLAAVGETPVSVSDPAAAMPADLQAIFAALVENLIKGGAKT
ncbi:MAG: FAD-dependent oxidoreductase [FCB group bacterium]|jgi:heterodisulfide reductase subunit A|nr:FAD-dependent oxidoreductase [FCB group bacterium]